MSRLNGWQRIWVVWSVTLTVMVISSIVIKWPNYELVAFSYEQTKNNEAQKRLTAHQVAVIDIIKAQVAAGNYDGPIPPSKTLADFYPAEEEMQKIKQRHDDSQRYKSNLAAEDRKHLLVSMLSAWVAGVFGTYAAGLTFAWVRRGFTRSN